MKKKISSNKSFGIVFSILFFILSVYPSYEGGNLDNFYLSLSLIFLTLGLFNSKILYPLNFLWNKIGIYLSFFLSPAIMFIVYFFLILPTKFFLLTLNKDILDLKLNSKKRAIG